MRSPAPKAVALWRYMVIEAALDEDLTRAGRAKLLLQISRTPLRWPRGMDQRVSVATLYRWLKAYREGGLDALRPKRRRDRGSRRAPLPEQVVRGAMRYLLEDPEQPWTFLLAVLRVDFPRVPISRSTLHRRVTEDPAYEEVKRVRQRHRRRRTRFVASRPHKRWQVDAKGPFEVCFSGGEVIAVHALTVLDDASRAVLAAHVFKSPNLGAAVRTFRHAAERWGLPEQYYADRASIFDAHAFRAGLADLGVHRIPTKKGNAPARGKIEAYHRVLNGWFIRRLRNQKVVDFAHLQQLLDAMIEMLYQPHRHRGLRAPPAEVLAGKVSSRNVPRSRLHEAFLTEKRKVTDRVSGEVDLQQATWIVPEALRGKRATFLLDPARTFDPLVVEPGTERRFALRRAAVRPEDAAEDPQRERWGDGPLQRLYDAWIGGAPRPQAEPGFGLPEVYALLTRIAGRQIPGSEHQAALVQRSYRKIGPLARKPTESAFAEIQRELGEGRPLQAYLDALERRVKPTFPKKSRRSRRWRHDRTE
ncbi:DDE-type integrase/transposase/recombinase [Planctomycetota bacterium]